MIMKDEVQRLSAFRDSLRLEDKPIFDDLMLQCELYSPDASSMASVVKEIVDSQYRLKYSNVREGGAVYGDFNVIRNVLTFAPR